MTTARNECSECKKTFTKRTKLIIHNAVAHGNKRLHDCPHCHERFRLRFHLLLHQSQKHPSRKLHAIKTNMFKNKRRLSFLCSYCGRLFHGSRLLQWHRQTAHKPQKLHHCFKRRKRLEGRNGIRNGIQGHKSAIFQGRNVKSLKIGSIGGISLSAKSDVQRVVTDNKVKPDLKHIPTMVAITQHSMPLQDNACLLRKKAVHRKECYASSGQSLYANS
jgi:uncharacterized Zn-finger protein